MHMFVLLTVDTADRPDHPGMAIFAEQVSMDVQITRARTMQLDSLLYKLYAVCGPNLRLLYLARA